MTLKNLRLALGLPLVLGACVATQDLGEPQGTDDGSGDATDTNAGSTTGDEDTGSETRPAARTKTR